MAAISETLRQARLRSGIDLDRLADKTKINPRYLQAIEAGDFGKLPSGIFARMFIKQYADAVGLDGASFADEFQRSMSFGHDSGLDVETLAGHRANYHPSVPGLSSVGDRVRRDRIASMLSSFIWVVAAILVCAGAYYGLTHLPAHFAVVPGSSTAKTAEPASNTASTPLPAHESSRSTSPPVSPPGQEASAQGPPSASPPASASPNAAPAVVGTAPPSTAAIRLAITATEPVWVTAIADGKTVVSELLPAGAGKIVDAAGSVRLRLGNAGGVDVTFNGKKLDPLGEKGQVRTVEFTPEGLQVISRTSPKVDPPLNPDPLR